MSDARTSAFDRSLHVFSHHRTFPGTISTVLRPVREELRSHGVIRYVADEKPAFPDRIEMRDVEIGETVLLVNRLHQPAENAYRASHAIFVREGASVRYDRVGEIPDVIGIRTFLCARSMGTT